MRKPFKSNCRKAIFSFFALEGAKIASQCTYRFVHIKLLQIILSLPDPMLNSDSNNMMEGTSDMDGEKTML